VDDGTIPTCELSDKANSAQEHQVDLHIADQTLGGMHQLVQSLQSHLLLSPASKLAGAQEKVFSRPAISEELRVGG
jgi:hypothetical protein